MKKLILGPGLNIQFPISQLIINGIKTVETRTYPIPNKFIGAKIAIIETPGKSGGFTARVIGTVIFGPSFVYETEEDFYLDQERHFVGRESKWAWAGKKKKWGWPVLAIKKFDTPAPAPKKRGIMYSKNIPLEF